MLPLVCISVETIDRSSCNRKSLSWVDCGNRNVTIRASGVAERKISCFKTAISQP